MKRTSASLAWRVSSVTWETEAMEASASPRKPSVWMCSRSSALSSLLVAWRSNASGASVDGNAVAVVDHPDQPPAALPYLDPDVGGASVQAVLHQFLDRGRGPFHHLAGGDAAGHFRGAGHESA